VAEICIVTASALGSNPRVVKEADALSAAGHGVHVISVRTLDFVDRRDEDVLRQANWSSERVDLRSAGRRRGLRLLQTGARGFYAATGRGAGLAYSIFGGALARRVLARKADLYIAHYVAALPSVAHAARRHGAKFAFDAEDFHPGEFSDGPQYDAEKRRIRTIEERCLPAAAYVTAASPGIAEAYGKAYAGIRPQVVLNCFPKRQAPVAATAKGSASPAPSVYWFSQTIGPDRGLECAVQAIAQARTRPHLYLRGTGSAAFLAKLKRLAEADGAGDRLHLLDPAAPSEMERLAAAYDVGLVAETGCTFNRQIALTNKQFTYLLAGIPCLMSDIPAHRSFSSLARGASFLFATESPTDLARALDELLDNSHALAAAREAAFRLGQERFNWEVEQQVLVQCVEAALMPDDARARRHGG
jgi:glycosyltransferase involved in cell wall biosynthesis